MTISNTAQFVLLLWKNWLLQKRRIVATVIQIVMPALFASFLLMLRTLVKSKYISSPTIWPSFEASTTLPSNLKPPGAPWMFVYSPNTSQAATRMAQNMIKMLGINPVPIGMKNEADVEKFFTNETRSKIALGAVVFDDGSFDAAGNIRHDASVKYKIRLRAEQYNGTYPVKKTTGRWGTKSRLTIRLAPGPVGDMYGGSAPVSVGYYYEGFLAVQRAVDLSIMSERVGNTSAGAPKLKNVDVQLKNFPYPPYLDDKFVAVIGQIGFIIMISFIATAPAICRDVVLEKEKKLKESMKLMGMRGWLHWASWYFKYSIFLLISVALLTLFLHIKIDSNRAIMVHSDPSVTFVFLLLFALANMTLCFVVTTFFSKASAGALAGGILYFFSFFPFVFVREPSRYVDLTTNAKLVMSLLPNLALPIGCKTLAQFELVGVGLQWSNINTFVSIEDKFKFSYTLIMLSVDIVIYSIITWYLDAVIPGDFGTPEPFYFLFTRSYWCGQTTNTMNVEDNKPDYGDRAALFEPTVSDRNIGIKIRGLTKKFGKKQRPAVDKLTIDIYEGDITALLGHNGAGKSTTMFMLTGFLPPTEGTAYISGLDIRRDVVTIRKSLGLCPQHDVLFDTMTVEEHLIFFARLKGCPKSEVKDEVDRMIGVLHLENKRDTFSKDLSGGMKRKLCVGIALAAGSKVVILDEATSGMDPEARRQTWDILQSQRAGRTMILSTHFMDEADLLGDRIAIMAEGQVQCCGSSIFLKNLYGIGYHLYIVKKPSCNVDNVLKAIKNHVPGAQVESNVGAELSFILPKEQSAKFEELFADLEKNQDSLGTDSFGVSVTTLEEVFLQVGAIHDATLRDNLQKGAPETDTAQTTSESVFGVPFRRTTGAVSSGAQRFQAMIVKNSIHMWRNRIVTIFQLLIPMIFAIIACTYVKTLPETDADPPPLTLDLSRFDKPTVPVTSVGQNALAAPLAKSYSDVSVEHGEPKDAGGSNMDDYLLDIAKNSLLDYNQLYIVAATANGTKNGRLVGHFNTYALHSIAISLSLVDNALFRYVVPDSHPIVTVNHPLPRTAETRHKDAGVYAEKMVDNLSFIFTVGLSFLIGSFVVFIVKQRSEKSKHSQFVSGVDAVSYWMAAFVWDFVTFTIASISISIVFLAFQVDVLTEWPVFGYLFLALILYGWSIIPFVYVQSFLCTVAASAYVWVTVINIFSGTVATLVISILRMPEIDMQNVADVVKWVFYAALPNFCFYVVIQNLYVKYTRAAACRKMDIPWTTFCEKIDKPLPCCLDNCGDKCADEYYSAMKDPGVGTQLVFMAAQGFLFLFILYVIESKVLHRVIRVLRGGRQDDSVRRRQVDLETTTASGTPADREDSDVAAERKRIISTSVNQLATTDAVVMRELTKVYGNGFVAVNRLSVGIPKGECFGLLGVNGAGKTTTFAMLTGDTTISSGNAFLVGMSVVRGIVGARRRLVGFCPQFDALIDQMTVRETLWMHARLRGIHADDIDKVVEKLIDQLTLKPYTNRQAGRLSGGNKRKLSTGVALMGNPSIIFLDEPTTGVDPVARRLLWNTLAQVRDSGKTIILSSHSMEECEALCTRLVIMVNGQFQCLGSTQHLKAKFGEGYSLIIKLRIPSADKESREKSLETKTQALIDYIGKTFPNSQLKDQHHGLIHYHVGRSAGVTWAQLFGAVERARSTHDIEDYSLSQTTLEQVFIGFARMQREPQHTSRSCIRTCCCWCCDRC